VGQEEIPPFENCPWLPATATSATFDHLLGGLTYHFAVRAWNEVGRDTWAVAYATLAPSVPEAPVLAEVGSGTRSVSVRWYEAYTGGSPLLAYELCASPDATFPEEATTCAQTDAPATFGWVPGLDPGTTYFARLRAVNAVGAGPWSDVSGTATPIAEPDAPGGVTATADVTSAMVNWTVSGDGGSPITGYVLTPIRDGIAQEPIKLSPYDRPHLVSGLQRGRAYSFTVAAVNQAGAGPASTPSPVVVPLRKGGPYAPFASWDAFVSGQLRDFTGSNGTAASRAPAVAALTAGTTTAEDYIESLVNLPAHQSVVAPTARLYWAYFNRIPDASGLRYWSDLRRRDMTLTRISSYFSASGEFKRKYGTLTDAQFVDLIYQNILGRPGDAGGRSYWITKLSRGTSRGQVMVNFSESGEYVRRMAAPVRVVDVFASMMVSSPTDSELSAWQGEDLHDVIVHVFDSDAYVNPYHR
jgi:hypothetical protein